MNAVLTSVRKPSPGRPFFVALAAVARSVAHKRQLDEELAKRFSPASDSFAAARATVRGTQPPASTTNPAYAAQLAQTTWIGALESMAATSVIASIPMLRVPFAGAGAVTVPARKPVATPNLAGTWRAEGAPIRVGALELVSRKLAPKSLGVIGTFTEELLSRSPDDVEAMIERAMKRDTGISLDAAFLDAEPASALRPAGLQAYASGAFSIPSSGTSVDAVTSDLRAAAAAMVNAGCGARPHWILNILVLQALMTLRDATGALAFPSLSASPPSLLTYPVVSSTTAPQDVVLLVDADELVVAGDAPKVDGTNVTVLHEEADAPEPISEPGAPAVVAAPARSLFQTAAAATRAVWGVDWSVLAEGGVVVITGVDAWLLP